MSPLPLSLLSRTFRPFLFCLLAAVTLLSPALAETLLGHCVGVADGDTCTLLLTDDAGGKRTEKIRFHGIDAPESRQAYGQAAKKFVSDLIYDKDIRVEVQTRDKYGRLVGKIFVGDTFVNLEVVKAGYAWWYRQYGAGETTIAEAEEAARTARRGLWQDQTPVAPWDFRHKGKSAAPAATKEPSSTGSGDDTQRYWITESTNKTHNRACKVYANSRGHYSATGTGNNCHICGGAR